MLSTRDMQDKSAIITEHVVGNIAILQSTIKELNAVSEIIGLTPKKLEKRLKDKFCPFCQDIEKANHKCVQPCNFVIRQDQGNEFKEAFKKEKLTRIEEQVKNSSVETMKVSVNSIEGVHSNKTITVTGRKGKHQFAIIN